MREPTRLPSLDGLRGIAAILVMFFHFDAFFAPQALLHEAIPILNRAYLAVDLFFLLSGFVMAHAYGQALASNWKANWRQFAISRFARIYPLFALTTLAMVIFVSVFRLQMPPISLSARSLMLQPLLLQAWSSGLSWNYPSWSISTEAGAYIFFVFSARILINGKTPRLMACCCAGVLIVLSLQHQGSLALFGELPALLRTLAEFSGGVLLYRAHCAVTRPPLWWVSVAAVLFAGLGYFTQLDVFVVGVLACLVYYGVSVKNLFGKLLNSRPAVALGHWSYSIYLWHAPTHYAVMAIFAVSGYAVPNLGLSSARLLILATAVFVIVLSAFQYHCFEKPARRVIVASLTGNRLRGGDVKSLQPHDRIRRIQRTSPTAQATSAEAE
jgi:peptidoglycan/LPS O-acetylase OafA/YrhL